MKTQKYRTCKILQNKRGQDVNTTILKPRAQVTALMTEDNTYHLLLTIKRISSVRELKPSKSKWTLQFQGKVPLKTMLIKDKIIRSGNHCSYFMTCM